MCKYILIDVRDINTVNNLATAYDSFKRMFSDNVIYYTLLGDKNLISTFTKSSLSSWISKYTAYNAIIDGMVAAEPILKVLKEKGTEDNTGISMTSSRPHNYITAPIDMSIFDISGTSGTFGSSTDTNDLLYKYNKWLESNRQSDEHSYIIIININEIDNHKLFKIDIDFIDMDTSIENFIYYADEYYMRILLMRILYNGMSIYGIKSNNEPW